MTYPHEIDEWRHAVHDMTEVEREAASDSDRAALGVIGDATDDLYGWGGRR